MQTKSFGCITKTQFKVNYNFRKLYDINLTEPFYIYKNIKLKNDIERNLKSQFDEIF